ncbi:MAG: hypothetical protein ABIS20_18230 [Thermoanaerobaculia bacterium]
MNETAASGSEKNSPPQSESGVEVSTTAKVTATAEPNKIEKVIVAVHGIGDQYSYATIQSVVNQFCCYYNQPSAVPLGNFHDDQAAYSIPLPYPREPFERLAFAEVYWAPIARGVENEKYTLEETKKWARTIVERLRLRWSTEGKKGGCREADFLLTQQVLGEMIQTIAVVDRLCFLADKAGLFTFDLRKLLDNYLGDVQIVAEFKKQRDEILVAFAKLLEKVEKAFPNADIYLVTHSEGTVVAFLGLLQALREPEPPRWTEKVRGLMTLGSPIDKHLALWPELFGEGPPSNKALVERNEDPQKRIDWRNYYDFGDPVGFKLDSVREWLEENHWKGVFNFDDDHDMGFTRYPFPGKAHVDYWTDKEVFGHFISTVVEAKPAKAAPSELRKARPVPPDLKAKQWLSYLLPYAGVIAILFVAAYILYKAVTEAMGYTGPPDPITGKMQSALTQLLIFKQTAGLAALLLGITTVARIPRLTRSTFWRRISVAIAGFGATAYMWSVHHNEVISLKNFRLPPGLVTLTLAIVVVCLVYLASVKRPSWGLTPLMVLGSVAVTTMVVSHLIMVPDRPSGPLWPVFLATAAFLYLWWLAALLFDLVFVWHLYIRHSKLMVRVNEVLGKYKDRVNPPSQQPLRAAAGTGSK